MSSPPRFGHVNVIAAPIDDSLRFRGRPNDPRERLEQDQTARCAAARLASMGGTDGQVALAPPFPGGGIEKITRSSV
jgi:hypothetical protein